MLLRFDKIDWKTVQEDKKLKLRVGIAVVLILFFAFFIDIIFSVANFKPVDEKTSASIKIKLKRAETPAKKVIKKKPVGVVAPILQKRHFWSFKGKSAKVAIILDDAGGNIPNYKEIFSIKQKLTISVIPTLPSSLKIAELAKSAGFEIMLHLPMEADNQNLTWKDAGMIKLSDSDEEIVRTLNDGLNNIKIAKGVNNHMGSRTTKDERVMRDILTVIKEKDLFFVDSKTTTSSVVTKIAKELDVRSAENGTFLDGSEDCADVEKKLHELIAKARRNGFAVGIGHATRACTISVLKRLMPVYSKEGIDFVYASEVVN